jgi:hypothetical protein
LAGKRGLPGRLTKKRDNMKIQEIRWLAVAAVLLTVVVTAETSRAQAGWLKFRPGPGITIESYKGNFVHFENLSFTTSTWFLSGEFEVSPDFYFVLELPYSHFDVKGEYDFKAENIVGNPYFGLRYEKETTGGIFRGGIRFPVIKAKNDQDYAMYYGMLTTFDRFEAFVQELFTISAMGGYKYVSPDGVAIRMMLGPVLFMPKDDDKELWGDYSIHFWYQNKALTVGGGMAGRILVASPYADEVDFGERLVNRLELAGKVMLGILSPGIHLQIPLDDDQNEEISSSYGLDLTVSF